MGVEILRHQRPFWTAGYHAPHCDLDGSALTSFQVSEHQGQWVLRGSVARGSLITWDSEHGDEVCVILSGSVSLDDQRCVEGGAIILESRVPGRLRVERDAELVHFGSSLGVPRTWGHYGPPASSDHGTHVLASEDVPVDVRSRDGSTTSIRWFADSSCRTCRLTLLEASSDAAWSAPSHTHSQDELIHVTRGSIRVGSLVVENGSTVCIPANHRYGFRTDGPYSFLNYRHDASYQVRRVHDEPRLEASPIRTDVVGRQASM